MPVFINHPRLTFRIRKLELDPIRFGRIARGTERNHITGANLRREHMVIAGDAEPDLLGIDEKLEFLIGGHDEVRRAPDHHPGHGGRGLAAGKLVGAGVGTGVDCILHHRHFHAHVVRLAIALETICALGLVALRCVGVQRFEALDIDDAIFDAQWQCVLLLIQSCARTVAFSVLPCTCTVAVSCHKASAVTVVENFASFKFDGVILLFLVLITDSSFSLCVHRQLIQLFTFSAS